MSGLNPPSGSSRRPSSRTPSMVSVGRMPMIAEDEAQLPHSQSTRPPHRRATSMPAYTAANLRRPSSISNKGSNRHSNPPIPERSANRPATARGRPRPASYAGSSLYGSSTYSMVNGTAVPPYPPPSYAPRDVYTDVTGCRMGLGSARVDQPDRNPPLKDEYSSMEKIKENPWVAKRGGWRRILLILAILIAVLVALAVGLTLGLKDRNSSSSSNSTDTTDDDAPREFPAGFFALSAALTNTSTSCTADPATWRCYPYTTYADASPPTDATAVFFWSILGPDEATGRHGYSISSADNPFAAQFADVPMTMRDGNTPDERLEFSLEMNRTMVPDSAASGFADDVRCEVPSVFRGVVWTGRMGHADRERGNVTVPGSHRGKSRAWDPWPGEVEIWQTADSAPRCTSQGGDEIPVGSRSGECLCRYANFDLD